MTLVYQIIILCESVSNIDSYIVSKVNEIT